MARPNSEEAKTAVILDVLDIVNALKGKTFSITGHLGRPRKEIIEIIRKCGGHFEERPKWGVNYLITNLDWNANTTVQPKKSSKLIDAERQGIKVISEKAFYEMIIAEDPSMKEMLGE